MSKLTCSLPGNTVGSMRTKQLFLVLSSGGWLELRSKEVTWRSDGKSRRTWSFEGRVDHAASGTLSESLHIERDDIAIWDGVSRVFHKRRSDPKRLCLRWTSGHREPRIGAGYHRPSYALMDTDFGVVTGRSVV